MENKARVRVDYNAALDAHGIEGILTPQDATNMLTAAVAAMIANGVSFPSISLAFETAMDMAKEAGIKASEPNTLH